MLAGLIDYLLYFFHQIRHAFVLDDSISQYKVALLCSIMQLLLVFNRNDLLQGFINHILHPQRNVFLKIVLHSEELIAKVIEYLIHIVELILDFCLRSRVLIQRQFLCFDVCYRGSDLLQLSLALPQMSLVLTEQVLSSRQLVIDV